MNVRRVLAGIALALGVLAVFVGSPQPRESAQGTTPTSKLDTASVKTLARQVEREEDHVTAIELATWIRERRPGLRVIDLRPPERFEEYHVPRAENLSLDSLVSQRFAPEETVVLYSQGGAHAAQGWVLLRALGHSRVHFVSGGLDEWMASVINPVLPEKMSPDDARVAELSRYFGGVPRRGTTATVRSRTVEEMRRRGC